MTNSILEKRWIWWAAAALIIILVVAWEVMHMSDQDMPIQRLSMPVSEIATLAEREDLNVMFILIDTLRADRLGTYGYSRNTSPTLDAMAAGGITFGHHLAQSSWTKASMASLWTGLYPARTGITRFDDVVPEEAALPAEILRDAGFRTVGFYRNGWISPTFGFEQGFEIYTNPARRPLAAKIRAANPTLSMVGTDEDTVAAATEFLRVSRNDQRWFLYLHFMDVHEYIYDEASAIFGSDISDKYDSSILWTDGTLNAFFSYLQYWGVFENTIIVVAADHGEAFRERGLEGHARAVYRESTTTPLIISLPFRLDPPIVVPTQTENVDVWPTIFDLLGIDYPSALDGRSRVPEILAAAENTTLPNSDVIGVSQLDKHWGQRGKDPRPFMAVTDGRYRYVRSAGLTDEVPALEELFDSETDPRELDDRSKDEPEQLEEFRALADEVIELESPWTAVPKRDLDEFELNQLRALGYSIP